MTIDQAETRADAVARAASLFGQRVKLERQAAGLTRAALSARCGVSAGYVARIEHGRANPTLDTMVKLADVFGGDLPAMLLPPPDGAGYSPTGS